VVVGGGGGGGSNRLRKKVRSSLNLKIFADGRKTPYLCLQSYQSYSDELDGKIPDAHISCDRYVFFSEKMGACCCEQKKNYEGGKPNIILWPPHLIDNSI
jgi:hypothetical protein